MHEFQSLNVPFGRVIISFTFGIRCNCMARNDADEEAEIELEEVGLDKEGVFAISNAAFDRGDEKRHRDFSQQFTPRHRESSHM